jgi:DNA-directed RNA polymerase specialized sigma24 family protein
MPDPKIKAKSHEEKIYRELKYLSRTIVGWKSLDPHQQKTAINDAFMVIWEKQSTGEVPKDDYQKYKGFMFIVLKSFILKNFYKRVRQVPTDYIAETSYNDPEYIQYYKDDERLKKLFDTLTPKQKAMVRWVMRGWEVYYCAEAFNMGLSNYNSDLQKIRRYLKEKLLSSYEHKRS